MNDTFDLQRFVDAQEGTYGRVLDELRAGRKRSHWMWFIFPQLAGLGHSPTAQHFAIGSADEAIAYLGHEQLGPRLVECTRLVVDIQGRTAEAIFGFPDYLKLRSSATLFARVSESEEVFQAVLDKYYDGEPDAKTIELLDARIR